MFALRRELGRARAAAYGAVQAAGGVLGVWTAHAMFEEPIWQVSTSSVRAAGMFAEAVATFGLI